MKLKDKLFGMSEQLKLLATDGILVKRSLVIVLVEFKESEWSDKL